MENYWYRIPGEKPVKKAGNWIRTDSLPDDCGNWVSDFDAKRFYYFIENENSTRFHPHFSKEILHEIDQKEYLETASQIIEELKHIKEGKAIFSRIEKHTFPGNKAPELFEQLCLAYPSAFVYIINSSNFGIWVGASPEILAKTTGNIGETMALAGTRPAENHSIWHNKELIEHASVKDYIEQKLKEFHAVSKIDISKTYNFKAGASEHLRTDFKFEIHPQELPALAINLHPTPAVLGYPREISRKLIKKYEIHERQLYCGILAVENRVCYVNLRCCEVHENDIHLYLGGGFNALSNPLDEWNETKLKARTILDVIENIQAV